jgi:hypothetical protein
MRTIIMYAIALGLLAIPYGLIFYPGKTIWVVATGISRLFWAAVGIAILVVLSGGGRKDEPKQPAPIATHQIGSK